MTGPRQAGDRRSARRWTLLPGFVVLGALFLPPSTSGTTGPAGPMVKDETFITAETGGLLHIEAGECFTDPAYSPEATEVVVLYTPCREQAANQSYGFVHAPDGEWDPAALTTFARESCRRGFDSNWSGESASGLDFYPVMPTRETWADGDRDVMCVVYSPEGPMNGSALPLAGW
ncbi:hypothetical protein ABZU75_15265 [Streptosporangium sp. NPDC005286]|uniref:hypothetical protein n=1 Tax=Streptosporangium sp. NPDC005286 TaxID=3154463 RepID=UPI0033A0CBA5